MTWFSWSLHAILVVRELEVYVCASKDSLWFSYQIVSSIYTRTQKGLKIEFDGGWIWIITMSHILAQFENNGSMIVAHIVHEKVARWRVDRQTDLFILCGENVKNMICHISYFIPVKVPWGQESFGRERFILPLSLFYRMRFYYNRVWMKLFEEFVNIDNFSLISKVTIRSPLNGDLSSFIFPWFFGVAL